jgi:hypothetical protein
MSSHTKPHHSHDHDHHRRVHSHLHVHASLSHHRGCDHNAMHMLSSAAAIAKSASERCCSPVTWLASKHSGPSAAEAETQVGRPPWVTSRPKASNAVTSAKGQQRT